MAMREPQELKELEKQAGKTDRFRPVNSKPIKPVGKKSDVDPPPLKKQ